MIKLEILFRFHNPLSRISESTSQRVHEPIGRIFEISTLRIIDISIIAPTRRLVDLLTR